MHILTIFQLNGLERVEREGKRAKTLLDEKSYGPALTAAENILNISPLSIEAKILRGRALIGLKQYSTATTLMRYAASIRFCFNKLQ